MVTTHSTLAPVFTGLRFGLHTLLLGLAVFVMVRAYVMASPVAPWVLLAGLAFVVVYLIGAFAARGAEQAKRTAAVYGEQLSDAPSRGFALIWITVLTMIWAVLVWLSPEGAFLVFPLFFLYLHILPEAGGVAAILVSTAFAICALGLHLGFELGGVIGPLIGACVALLIGFTYRALRREAHERERLVEELLRTRAALAATEREQGALAERARLAREIHDTVAQGLSSIQMLLRAAEPDIAEPAAGYLRLARETAADSLADTRQIIRELTPTRLDDGLAAALGRLGEDQTARTNIPVAVRAEDLELPMDVQTALLRIAQGALSNSVRHANASNISIELTGLDRAVLLVIRDDGVGFDATAAVAVSHEAGSFGLQAMQERVRQFGGTLTIVSSESDGTEIRAQLPLGEASGGAS